MEIILAICITGLGIFGGMLVIWNGQNPIPCQGTRHLRKEHRDIKNNTDPLPHNSSVVIRNHPFGDLHQGKGDAQLARSTRKVDSLIGV